MIRHPCGLSTADTDGFPFSCPPAETGWDDRDDSSSDGAPGQRVSCLYNGNRLISGAEVRFVFSL